jgi:hypothetical protein
LSFIMFMNSFTAGFSTRSAGSFAFEGVISWITTRLIAATSRLVCFGSTRKH